MLRHRQPANSGSRHRYSIQRRRANKRFVIAKSRAVGGAVTMRATQADARRNTALSSARKVRARVPYFPAFPLIPRCFSFSCVFRANVIRADARSGASEKRCESKNFNLHIVEILKSSAVAHRLPLVRKDDSLNLVKISLQIIFRIGDELCCARVAFTTSIFKFHVSHFAICVCDRLRIRCRARRHPPFHET